jgi:uncharacterized protein
MLEAQIFIDQDEQKEGKPLHEYIMKYLMDWGVSGATSFRGHSGFGKNQRMKHPNEFFSFDEPPVLIVFIDNEEKVKTILSALRKVTSRGFITVHKVEKW